jgi:hypothetical protein
MHQTTICPSITVAYLVTSLRDLKLPRDTPVMISIRDPEHDTRLYWYADNDFFDDDELQFRAGESIDADDHDHWFALSRFLPSGPVGYAARSVDELADPDRVLRVGELTKLVIARARANPKSCTYVAAFDGEFPNADEGFVADLLRLVVEDGPHGKLLILEGDYPGLVDEIQELVGS